MQIEEFGMCFKVLILTISCEIEIYMPKKRMDSEKREEGYGNDHNHHLWWSNGSNKKKTYSGCKKKIIISKLIHQSLYE